MGLTDGFNCEEKSEWTKRKTLSHAERVAVVEQNKQITITDKHVVLKGQQVKFLSILGACSENHIYGVVPILGGKDVHTGTKGILL